MLTTPIQSARLRAYRAARRVARRIVKPRTPLPAVSRYPGHYAVVRSVVEGLSGIHADFNHDPRTFRKLARIVYAPANEALRQAALLKQKGRIDFLVAGPSNAFFPEEADNILWLPEIDIIIEPSEWVRQMLSFHAPALVSKIRICTAGVDADDWSPAGARRSRRIIVYWKSGDESFCRDVEEIVRQLGFEPVRFRYGHYSRDEYKRELGRASLAVFLSSFETQGIALAEAWAMDVPTLVWDPKATASWRGRSFISGSSAPYLSASTGIAWEDISDLPRVAKAALGRLDKFSPRRWVLENMTDEICAARLLQIIETESRSRLQSRPR